MKTKLLLLVSVLLLLGTIFSGCRDVNSYKTFVLNEGTVHFSFEYRTYYKIDEVKPGGNTGVSTKDLMYVTLISPRIAGTKDYTRIDIIVDKPDWLVPDAKSGIERAERNYSSWKYYKLLDKFDISIDGLHAYRLDNEMINIVPAIAGTGKPAIEVDRTVEFDAKGFVWFIQMTSDSSTAEADKADFEHILQTFKILD